MKLTILTVSLIIVGLFAGISLTMLINVFRRNFMMKKATDFLEKARVDAESIKRDYLLDAKEEAHALKIETDEFIKEKKEEVKVLEERLTNRESGIEKREYGVQSREILIGERELTLSKKQEDILTRETDLEKIKNEQIIKLEQISGLSRKEAEVKIMDNVMKEMDLEIGSYIKTREDDAKLTADRHARSMLVGSMQRYAGDVASERTVSVVSLPSDDMKGRLIGREGRNIRTIEAVTGVDLIIDDTPEAIVLSTFDPYRREIAKITVETLIKDGRIHPARIEEVYDKATEEMKQAVMEYGEGALFDLGITNMDPELIFLVGKLNFRTSYGQNGLKHALEVANLTGVLAAELGENITLAKRAGLLHDIGKSIDHEIEGSHVDIGAEVASKFNEVQEVMDGIESHHGDKPAKTIIGELVSIADALSASRPGARNDSLENYIKRLKDLEETASTLPGVDKVYAMQAGRELRVIVKPSEVNDEQSRKIAREVKENIEANLQYPGTIKIMVIRETRAIEEAK